MAKVIKKSQPLQGRFIVFSIILLAFVVATGILTVILYQNQKNLARSRDVMFNSYLLADELRQSSDDLTRFARAYVATGNIEFEKEYWTILDIRNGKISRPTDYNRIYWDFIIADGKKPRPDSSAIPLQTLMEQAGFTQEEFAKLALAQKNSDALVKVEEEAMNAVKGFFKNADGQYTVIKAPDFNLANNLMNNENYYKIKAEIMRPIDEFYQLFQTRTASEVQKYLGYAYTLFTLLLASVSITLLAFIYSFINLLYRIKEREQISNNLKKQIVQKEQVQKDLIALSKSLEAKVQERTEQLEKSEQAVKEALERTEKLNTMMVRREFEKMETKKKAESPEK